jgi:hypothetical protein
MLSAVLQPPVAASPFQLAHDIEAMLYDRHGFATDAGKHRYVKHWYMIYCLLGGRELSEAAEARQRALQEAAAAAREDAPVTAAAAAAAAKAAADKAAAAAIAVFDGKPGADEVATLRGALLEGALSADEVFAVTLKGLGFD